MADLFTQKPVNEAKSAICRSSIRSKPTACNQVGELFIIFNQLPCARAGLLCMDVKTYSRFPSTCAFQGTII